MKTGLTISAVGHAAVLLWSALSFAAKPLDVPPVESMPVDIISAKEFSQITAGAKNAKPAETPKPLIEKVAEKKPVDDPTPKIDEKRQVVAARDSAPPPMPEVRPPEPKPQPPMAEAKPPEPKPPEPKKAEPKPEPPKPDKAEAKPEKAEAKLEPKPEPKKPEPKKAEVKLEKKPPEKKPVDQIAEALKKDEARPQPQPKPPIPVPPKFDPMKIAALLNKEEARRSAAGGDRINHQVSLGLSSGQAAHLSQSELDALRARLASLWNPPAGARSPEQLVVQVRIQLTPDGKLAAPPMVLSSGRDPLFVAARDSAVRAIFRGQPFDMLRRETYETWKDVEITFDPRQMFPG